MDRKWIDIIRREWRYCQDRELADQMFEAISDLPDYRQPESNLSIISITIFAAWACWSIGTICSNIHILNAPGKWEIFNPESIIFVGLGLILGILLKPKIARFLNRKTLGRYFFKPAQPDLPIEPVNLYQKSKVEIFRRLPEFIRALPYFLILGITISPTGHRALSVLLFIIPLFLLFSTAYFLKIKQRRMWLFVKKLGRIKINLPQIKRRPILVIFRKIPKFFLLLIIAAVIGLEIGLLINKVVTFSGYEKTNVLGFNWFITSPVLGLSVGLSVRYLIRLRYLIFWAIGPGISWGFNLYPELNGTQSFSTVFGDAFYLAAFCLGALLSHLFMDRIYRYYDPKRPNILEVKRALEVIHSTNWTGPLQRLQNEEKQEPSPDFLIDYYLGSRYWALRFIARYLLVKAGGQAVEPLRAIAEKGSSENKKTARWLLKNIADITTANLKENASTLFCLECFAYCDAHRIVLTRHQDYTYYGCRLCGKSNDFVTLTGHVVIVLDQNMTESYGRNKNHLHLNWLKHKEFLDFDAVLIRQVSDKETEEFAIRVGNDTNEYRLKRYKKMTCVIDADSSITENTIRILKSIFGQIKIED